MRFLEMDQNHNGVIARNEWSGSPASFQTQCWQSGQKGLTFRSSHHGSATSTASDEPSRRLEVLVADRDFSSIPWPLNRKRRQ
jgi:hypothetical protein